MRAGKYSKEVSRYLVKEQLRASCSAPAATAAAQQTASQRCGKKARQTRQTCHEMRAKNQAILPSESDHFSDSLAPKRGTRLSEGHPTVGAGRRPIGEPRCLAVLLSDMGPENFPALTALRGGGVVGPVAAGVLVGGGGRPSQAGLTSQTGCS